MTGPRRCASCDAELRGLYCSECGERALRADEFSVRRLVVDALRDAAAFDSKLWRSFRLLIARPGELTRRYMSGQRVGLVGPVQLFLTCNLIYFVVQPHTGFTGYNTTLGSHMDRQVYSQAANIRGRVTSDVQARVDQRVAQGLERMRSEGGAPTAADSLDLRQTAAAVESEVYPARFDARGEVFARALVGLIIPMLVVSLALLYLGRGEPFVKHVVFATSFHAWELLFVGSMVLPLWGPLMRALAALTGLFVGMSLSEVLTHPLGGRVFDLASELGSLIFVVIYLYFGLHRAYGGHRLATAGRAVAVAVSSLLATVVYRFILFWPTWWSM